MTSFVVEYPNKVVKHIAIVIAMRAEAEPFITKLNLKDSKRACKLVPSTFPAEIYSGKYKDEYTISVIVNGADSRFNVDNVGTTSASISAFIAISELQPDLLLSTGTAGGFKRKGAEIGDPFVSTFHVHHDRRIPIPGFTEYGIGLRPAHPCKNLINTLGFKFGVLTSSNSLDHNEDDDKIMLEYDAAFKEMEAASIAWVAEHCQVPFVSIKVITDIVDGDRPTHEEFLENLGTASQSLQKMLPDVIDFIFGKKLSEL
eukprot:gene5867-8091_t